MNKDYLTRVAEAAFFAGYMHSGEGHNGEMDCHLDLDGYQDDKANWLAESYRQEKIVETIKSVPRPEPVADLPAVPDGLLTAVDMKHLQRFAECAEDCDGHDVPKEDMNRLERLGAVRSLGFGRHETTAFGDAILAETTGPADDAATLRKQNAALVAALHMYMSAGFGQSTDFRKQGEAYDAAIEVLTSAKGGA